MIGVSRAALAAALLGCALPAARAQGDSHWLVDAQTGCAVYDANAHAGDTVSWSGACLDGYADGDGTAAFSSQDKVFESFTGNFARGVAQDGHVSVAWGDGWTYDGNSAHGLFNGAGTLVNDKRDRFEGNWVDGQMNGHGTVIRANGERYDGQWKNDLPNGNGILRRADGSTTQGTFVDGQLVGVNVLAQAAQAADPAPASVPVPAASAAPAPEQPTPVLARAPAPPPEPKPAQKPVEKPVIAATPRGFDSLSGKVLTAVDGSRIALTMIEGGIERQITAAGGSSQKTTFTFMNDRLGTVVEDGGPAAGANVTGFFRVTGNGVEVRYADGRAEMLTASSDGGLLMSLVSASGDNSCRSWYPDGHIFSEEEKKAALAAYASKLGLPSPVAVKLNSCGPGPAAIPEAKPAKPGAKAPAAHAAYQPRAPKLASLETVAVRESAVHTIDPPLMPEGDAPVAGASSLSSVLPSKPGERDASHCLKVESDGHDWGFRNACGFSVQFAYCALEGGEGLNDCSRGGATGSVAANGFGALSADRSFSEANATHDFRWVACDGGAGEVIAHLDHADPPSGHCERSAPIDDTANAH
jgi:hypothetical protein